MKLAVLFLALYCGLIFTLSHQPVLPMPMAFPHQDKLVHAVAYATMGLLAWRVFMYLPCSHAKTAVFSLLFCSLYGMSDEFHQSFIAGRNADAWDWVADTLGAGLMISMLMWKRNKF